ncbi:flagellar biosynthesis repressor FlbT [Aureimonas mangrovi]|uniref:flagellar biosynthesis repressor FlbT n=1 Tax=Aureimonas mangrovi TaxID=2758041 RepID=UPI00163D76CA|nr:flagellar biosynthesis repressor FlbT [Aureimonas mangrovi]
MGSLKISLRAGERLFLNGAVLRVDRKTQVELLNDVTFLLESHVMQAADTVTPVRQLYFVVQMMLIDPANAVEARKVFEASNALLLAAFESAEMRGGLLDVQDLVARDRAFEALKRLRALIPLEDAILGEKGGPKLPAAEIVPLAAVAGARR